MGKTRRAKPVNKFPVVHSVEKPWVKEPRYKRWIGKLRRHTAKVKREGEDESPMNLCVDSDLCKGDLGIPRRLMPQFTSPEAIADYRKFLGRYGIRSWRDTRRAGRLRPSQEEISRERVHSVEDDIEARRLDPRIPLIVSKDGYVIDGHHRWAAYRRFKPLKQLPVLVVNAPARDVLGSAAAWGAEAHQF